MPDLHVHVDGHHQQLAPIAEGDGRPLSELLAERGWGLDLRCSGRGRCNGCRVDLRRGSLRAADGTLVAAPAHGLRACQHRVADQPIALAVPDSSLPHRATTIVDSFLLERPLAPVPGLGATPLAIAVDLGTTTVVAALCDRSTATVLARASAANGQTAHGADVLARIQHCLLDEGMVATLQQAATATIRCLVDELLVGRERTAVGAMAVAGNTTMLHLLAGVNPKSLGTAPFTPVFTTARALPAADIGLACDVQLLPSAAGYLGADIVAGLAAGDLAGREGPRLFVDVGTNGEIVVAHDGRLLACATAAGPAFEGAGLACGSRARPGAVAHVDHDWRLQVIGNGQPDAICGTGYVDLLARGVEQGVLDVTGRIDADAGRARGLRIEDDDYGLRLVLAEGVHLAETDVAMLLQAKAAIAAGIAVLLDLAGVAAEHLVALDVAGGFGLHLDLAAAMTCGLLPALPPGRARAIGNTSLAGAVHALHGPGDFTAECAELAGSMEVIELNLQPGFEDRYIDALMLM